MVQCVLCFVCFSCAVCNCILYTVHYTLWCELCVQCGPLTELDKGIVARDKGSFSIDTGVAGILTNKFTFLWETVEEEGGGDSKAFNAMAAAASFLLLVVYYTSVQFQRFAGIWCLERCKRRSWKPLYKRPSGCLARQGCIWKLSRSKCCSCKGLNKKACRKFCQNPK